MNFIAIKMLVGDRAKYIGILIGLTFASLLITQQNGHFLRFNDPNLRRNLRPRPARHLGHG